MSRELRVLVAGYVVLLGILLAVVLILRGCDVVAADRWQTFVWTFPSPTASRIELRRKCLGDAAFGLDGITERGVTDLCVPTERRDVETRQLSPIWDCGFTVRGADVDCWYEVRGYNPTTGERSEWVRTPELSCEYEGGSGCPTANWPTPAGALP